MVQDSASDHCSVAYPGKPIIQYAIMIDAGSSGSRVHIYKFNHCKQYPELENEVFKMISPGLSSYAPQDAADSLHDLLQLAVESVPKDMHHCTPIAVKATAGLRLLGTDKSRDILNAVRKTIEEQYPFPVNSIEIMEGTDEGVYAWITVNYLLGNLKPNGTSVATFDLGGASTQIVMEPELDMMAGDHQYQLSYANRDYNLYQHSYLGFGLMEARRRAKEQIVKSWKDTVPNSVHHPCLPKGHKEMIKWTDFTVTKNVELVGTGAGHAACRAVIEKIFEKEKTCPISPCGFNGIYQPSITDNFSDRDLYLFSFFYDLTEPLGMLSDFTVREFGELAYKVCNGDPELFRYIPNALNVLQKSPDYCLDLTYTHALLRIGYEVPPERLVRTAKKIRDAETGWCLGASITMIDQNQLCKN
ncbi:hypothetical protein HPULCUR_011085 [Helicostylum pulchrum]|uniref:guanosine-diphosphatase n=1 Tax=Helicostylum pulchrum TaxID=562976 RepID=A0ABP9YF68_9FUNG